ncbi:MAG TPA: PHB depolymerase family esterase [Aquabacterium sp.]|nr:PHB depolymerase family esterase [Aquabacterium sp.]
MPPDFQRLMQDATRLTRQGDLQAATAAIQAALRQTAAEPPYANAALVIDVEAREVHSPTEARPALPGTSPNAPAADAQPVREAFVAGRFGPPGAAGRDYKLYIPPQAQAQPRPLVVMLHGCTQHADDFAAGTAMNEAARAQGCYVLYPVQSDKANPQRCWNWFKHSHQGRGRGEPAILAGMTRQVMAEHGIDPARVYVAGLSAGGAMAAILGEAYPELYAAVGVHSGLAAGAARDLPSALQAMKSGAARSRHAAHGVPTIVFHGDADQTVHPANGGQVFAASAGAASKAEVVRQQQPGRRQVTRHLVRDAGGGVVAEHWVVHGAGHAWSGGTRRGSYTDPQGPDASGEMLRFFLEHPRRPRH